MAPALRPIKKAFMVPPYGTLRKQVRCHCTRRGRKLCLDSRFWLSEHPLRRFRLVLRIPLFPLAGSADGPPGCRWRQPVQPFRSPSRLLRPLGGPGPPGSRGRFRLAAAKAAGCIRHCQTYPCGLLIQSSTRICQQDAREFRHFLPGSGFQCVPISIKKYI